MGCVCRVMSEYMLSEAYIKKKKMGLLLVVVVETM